MTTIDVSFPAQSSAGDWKLTQQIVSDADGQPCWAAVPGDLIVTMTVVPEGISVRRDYGSVGSLAGSSVIIAKTNDLTGRLTAFANGFVQVIIDADDMGALAPDRYGVCKRHLVKFKIEVSGETRDYMTGVLPVFLGA